MAARAVLLRAGLALLAQALLLCRGFDLRVAKGHHSRGYHFVRLSVIGQNESEQVGTPGGWTWKRPFAHRWTSKILHTKVMEVPANGTVVRIGEEDVRLKIPAPGAGVTGFFVSDACFSSLGGLACPNEKRFKMLDRLAELVNTLMGSDEFDFWGMLGDNFYDHGGDVTAEFFGRLTTKVKSKPFLTVAGNHDFWVGGGPPGNLQDQLGYGHMQFYGQDTVGGLRREDGAPYDLAAGQGLEPARAENFVFGTQLGDMAFFGYAGNFPWAVVEPHARRFCRFAGGAASVRSVAVLGHWNTADLGCLVGMDVPSVYHKMRAMEGCREKRVLYFMGHEHCNRVDPPRARSDPLAAVGFVVGGAGMWGNGCSEFGFTVVQSDPGAKGGHNVRVDHFPIARDTSYGKDPGSIMDRYDWLIGCLKEYGYRGCRSTHGLSFRATSMDDIVKPSLTSSTLTSTRTTQTTTSSTSTSTSTTATGTTTTSTSTQTTTTSTSSPVTAAALHRMTVHCMLVFPPAIAGGFLMTLVLLRTSLPCCWFSGEGGLKNCKRSRSSRVDPSYAILAGSLSDLPLRGAHGKASGLVRHVVDESDDEGDGGLERETPGSPPELETPGGGLPAWAPGAAPLLAGAGAGARGAAEAEEQETPSNSLPAPALQAASLVGGLAGAPGFVTSEEKSLQLATLELLKAQGAVGSPFLEKRQLSKPNY